jgi:DNA-binding transcriptional LysR family regulator
MRHAEDMAVMLRVADRGGFTAAAEDVGLTPSAVAKLITRLEHRLGVRLLNRTTRRVTLTTEGERYVSEARRILGDIEAFEADLTAHGAKPRGRLRVACGTAVGLDPLIQGLAAFRSQYPEITLDFLLSDRRIDLVEEQIDIALRMGPLVDSSLVSRRICTFSRIICAAPAYLERAGPLATPDDLMAHECLYATSFPSLSQWPFRHGAGIRIIEVSGRIQFNMASAVLSACLAGVGIARITDLLAMPEVRAGRLVPLLTHEHLPEPVDLTALMPSNRHRTPKVRVFLEFLSTTFTTASLG